MSDKEIKSKAKPDIKSKFKEGVTYYPHKYTKKKTAGDTKPGPAKPSAAVQKVIEHYKGAFSDEIYSTYYYLKGMYSVNVKNIKKRNGTVPTEDVYHCRYAILKFIRGADEEQLKTVNEFWKNYK
jgi:hypothetical protein